ncbi:MAG: leucyl aminopeptidase family protein, partial [Chlamydiota bacterium]
MKTEISFSAPSQVETECLAVVVLDRGENSKPNPSLETSDKAVGAAVADLLASGEVTGKIFETTLVHHPQGLKAKRLLLVGGGKASSFSGYELRKLAGAAVRFLKPRSIRSFAFAAPEGAGDAVKAVVEGALVGNFDPDTYKSDRKDQRVEQMTVVAPAGQDEARLRRALEEGRIVGESQNFTRELVNEPSNRLTPTVLAQRASEMVREIARNANGFRLSVETYGADKIKELKMGAFWSVAQGSDEPPALIVIKYEPEGAPEKPVLGLVGKGITFDTGGISIKPADGMEKMKYDMAGGAAMLGAMRAIALLRPKVKVIAIVCATENMPS